MKNYELISELSKFPAGAEVTFSSICDTSEVCEEVSGKEINYAVTKDICFVDDSSGRIMLS